MPVVARVRLGAGFTCRRPRVAAGELNVVYLVVRLAADVKGERVVDQLTRRNDGEQGCNQDASQGTFANCDHPANLRATRFDDKRSARAQYGSADGPVSPKVKW